MHAPSSVIDLRLGSKVERHDVGEMIFAIVSHLAMQGDTRVDLFDPLDAVCHEFAAASTGDEQRPTWAFWADRGHLGVAATCAENVIARMPLAAALGELTASGGVVTWQLAGRTEPTPVPPPPVDDPDRLFRLRVPAAFEHAAAVRALVRCVVDFDDEGAEARYLIAATEIFTNAVRANHRRTHAPPVEIDVDSAAGADGPALIIADHCGGWSPDRLGPAERESGLAIARAFVPNLSHSSIDGGCSVSLPFPSTR